MDKLGSLLLWLHVSGNLVWIGAILAVGAALTSPAAGADGSAEADPRALRLRGEIALRIYMRLAVPAFLVSFACGATRLLMDTSYYLVEHHWMHPKLTVALVVIGLHHVIGARAKRAARPDAGASASAASASGIPGQAQPRGTVQEGRTTAMLCMVLAVAAALAAFFVIFRVPR